MRERTKAWLKFVDDDMTSANVLLNSSEVYAAVLFHLQQAVEKAFKAILENESIPTPKIHDLIILYKQIPAKIKNRLNIRKDDLQDLTSIYTDTRYPGEVGLLPNGEPTKDNASEMYGLCKAIITQIKEVLSEAT